MLYFNNLLTLRKSSIVIVYNMSTHSEYYRAEEVRLIVVASIYYMYLIMHYHYITGLNLVKYPVLA